MAEGIIFLGSIKGKARRERKMKDYNKFTDKYPVTTPKITEKEKTG
jgi:hypothetical protein